MNAYSKSLRSIAKAIKSGEPRSVKEMARRIMIAADMLEDVINENRELQRKLELAEAWRAGFEKGCEARTAKEYL